MRVLGVDPGYSLGYALLEGDRLVEHGTLSPKGTTAERLSSLYKGVLELINRLDAQVVALEKAFYGRSVPSLVKLAQVRGVVLAAAGTAGVEVVEVHPAEAKRGITGRGSATKEQVVFMVKNIFNLDKITTHEADAISIAFFISKGGEHG